MAQPAPRSALASLHAAVLLFGLAGLFGKWIAADPIVIVFGRTVVASVAFLLLLPWRGESLRRPVGRDWLLLPLTGVVLAVHWVAFFRAVQLSTLAVALLSYATAPVFAAVLEPVAFRERLSLRAVAAAALTLAGIAFIVPRWSPADATAAGVAWGVLSGFTFAVLSLLNRALVRRSGLLQLAFMQDGVAMLAVLPLVPAVWTGLGIRDLALLGVLGLVCTALSHTLYIAALRSLPARTAAIVSALEPVYGIALAALLLGEIPTERSVAGGLLVLASVLWVTLRPEPIADLS